jgi:hypothetical protein
MRELRVGDIIQFGSLGGYAGLIATVKSVEEDKAKIDVFSNMGVIDSYVEAEFEEETSDAFQVVGRLHWLDGKILWPKRKPSFSWCGIDFHIDIDRSEGTITTYSAYGHPNIFITYDAVERFWYATYKIANDCIRVGKRSKEFALRTLYDHVRRYGKHMSGLIDQVEEYDRSSKE